MAQMTAWNSWCVRQNKVAMSVLLSPSVSSTYSKAKLVPLGFIIAHLSLQRRLQSNVFKSVKGDALYRRRCTGL